MYDVVLLLAVASHHRDVSCNAFWVESGVRRVGIRVASENKAFRCCLKGVWINGFTSTFEDVCWEFKSPHYGARRTRKGHFTILWISKPGKCRG